MKIIEVKDPYTQKEFLKLPLKIYKNDPNWVQPLDQDIEKVFDPQKNIYFQFGECTRWLLQNDQNQTIGRVAAFYDKRIVDDPQANEQPTGGMGFFECIDDQKAANLLFDTCKAWLQSKNIEAMDGPINFGTRANWWGLLIQGFFPPNYQINYHPTYYKALFENYGFQEYFQQYTYQRSVGALSERSLEKAKRLTDKPEYSFVHISKQNMQKYVKDFQMMYNEAWAKFENVPPLSEKETQKELEKIRPIMDERLIWFAYYNDKPIGFFVMIPDINQIFKYVGGKLDLLGKLKFLYYKWTKGFDKSLGIVFGVIPRFQGKGVDTGMIVAFYYETLKPNFPYKDLEMNWVGDFNKPIIHLLEGIDFTLKKVHATYRKLFDETKEFKRYEFKKK